MYVSFSHLLLLLWFVSIVFSDYDLFDIAQGIYQNRTDTTSSSLLKIAKLHLIRVPKASSSALSMVARRIAGCNPPGPCCRWPGDPPGSCPAKGLFKCEVQKRVIGCTDHYPNYPALLDNSIFSMTMFREPFCRIFSAYGYGAIHYNSQCTPKGSPACLQDYINSKKWSNVGVKLLTGKYAYEDVGTCRNISQCPHSLELALHNLKHLHSVGVTEHWQLSLLLLHVKLPALLPMHREFLLGSKKVLPAEAGLRIKASNTTSFSLLVAYHEQILDRNALDVELYNAVLRRMCDELHGLGLWPQHERVRLSWRSKALFNVSNCI
jgi:hypothetical protein